MLRRKSLVLMVFMLVASLGAILLKAYSNSTTVTQATYIDDSGGTQPWCQGYAQHAYITDYTGLVDYDASTTVSHHTQTVSSILYFDVDFGPAEFTVITAAAGKASYENTYHLSTTSSWSTIWVSQSENDWYPDSIPEFMQSD